MPVRSNIILSNGIKWLFIGLVILIPIGSLFSCSPIPGTPATGPVTIENTTVKDSSRSLQTGAEQCNLYLALLKNKKVGLVVNHTSVIQQTHLADSLKSLGITIVRIFAPEHGFRGTADAGEYVASYVDSKTGIPVISLYGKNKKPSAEHLSDLDIIVYDIQDVGARFYTYISTMYLLMEACAENNKPLLILDRPNPNGDYIDGPVLDLSLKSFVGMLPIPVVHGLTVGELAQMINGEKWLKDSLQCMLHIIPVSGYTHSTPYHLQIKPSPNLPNDQAIRLYPSLCFFEGTTVSVGRGTDFPFQVIGSPFVKDSFSFTPVSRPGMATDPMFKNQLCYGKDLRNVPSEKKIQLSYLLDMYALSSNKSLFFGTTNFFDKLAGTTDLKQQILKGMSEEAIRQTWAAGLTLYKSKRKKYLLYRDFE